MIDRMSRTPRTVQQRNAMNLLLNALVRPNDSLLNAIEFMAIHANAFSALAEEIEDLGLWAGDPCMELGHLFGPSGPDSDSDSDPAPMI